MYHGPRLGHAHQVTVSDIAEREAHMRMRPDEMLEMQMSGSHQRRHHTHEGALHRGTSPSMGPPTPHMYTHNGMFHYPHAPVQPAPPPQGVQPHSNVVPLFTNGAYPQAVGHMYARHGQTQFVCSQPTMHGNSQQNGYFVNYNKHKEVAVNQNHVEDSDGALEALVQMK